MGNSDVQMDNEVFDSWSRERNATPPETPAPLYPNENSADVDGRLVASNFIGEHEIMSSHFQVSDEGDYWTQSIFESKRDWENVYYDSGPPNFTPIDLNEGIDLRRVEIPEGTLQSLQPYEWRVRYRDQNLLWSEWSDPQFFYPVQTGTYAFFTADMTTGDIPFEVHFTDLSGGDPLSWEWDFDSDGNIDSYERDPVWVYTQGGSYSVTLTVNFQGESDTIIRTDFIYAGDFSSLDIPYNEGWNMIGVPLLAEDTHHMSLFPDAVEGALYSFDNGYMFNPNMTPGIGYWLRFSNTGLSTIEGFVIPELVLNLQVNWNLISGNATEIPVTSIIDPLGIIVPNTFYFYEEAYVNVESLVPGRSYWMRASESGTIIIPNSVQRRRSSSVNYNLSSTANTLELNGTILYFGIEVPEYELLSYSLPPKPPMPSTDIRFSGDTKLCTTNECVIEVMGDGEPLTFEFDIKNGEVWEIVPVIANQVQLDKAIYLTGESIYTLDSKVEQYILRKSTKTVPSTFALHPAYPNPFNPITTLRYDLPEPAFVTLTIFDMMGREISQLVNKNQEAGFKSIVWNGTDNMGRPVSAGVYLYRIQAGEFVQTKKMVLLK